MRDNSAVRILTTAMVGASLLFGCASLPPPSPYAEDAPYKSVRLVGRAPSGGEYLGEVKGVAPREGFVDQAHDARIDIKTRAAWLGADVVQIEKVKVPSASKKGKRQVLLTGRAYRSAKFRKTLGRRHHAA